MLIMSIRRLCRCIDIGFIGDLISFGLEIQYISSLYSCGGLLILVGLVFFCYTVDMTLNLLDIMSTNE